MFPNTLDKKPLIKDSNNNYIKDLTQSMFDFRSNNYVSYNMFRISRDYLMRPDLISQAAYNNTVYAEYILKYNGISNPFSMEEGDIVLIPNLEGAKNNTKSSASISSESDPSQKIRESYKYVDPTKIPKKDINTSNFNNRNLNAIQEGALPPNIAEPGVSQIVQRNGRVYFGEGIGESACLKNGMSSSEFLTNIIKSSSS